ncbi:hypothetical protein F5144DRAFT_543469 [Chaetomium tenue]|uniref:Uncharacterized protein n=1 Tax=Chaetomium tenue TaxID=1854479 RepID=A0ACB7PMG5_9PEZI|nr:hypothetical protein F5144DRAFT_543469 [Chaetomium globosum]
MYQVPHCQGQGQGILGTPSTIVICAISTIAWPAAVRLQGRIGTPATGGYGSPPSTRTKKFVVNPLPTLASLGFLRLFQTSEKTVKTDSGPRTETSFPVRPR